MHEVGIVGIQDVFKREERCGPRKEEVMAGEGWGRGKVQVDERGVLARGSAG